VTVTLDDLGAWLVKGNADTTDLTDRFARDPRVRRETLRADARLAAAEVLRQPQGPNPSYLTVAQFAALREHLPPSA
jgi:hypothetical protein